MAETNTPSVGGEATTNTKTGVETTASGAKNTSTGGDTVTNTAVVSAGSGGTTPDKEKTDVGAPAVQGKALPYPHNALSGIEVQASSYKDLIKEVYDEHEKALKNKESNRYEPSPEMLAARDDAQVTLANQLRASLKAERSMSARDTANEHDTVTIKLSKPHIHAGVAYHEGDEIKVDEGSAKFIEEAKVGKRV